MPGTQAPSPATPVPPAWSLELISSKIVTKEVSVPKRNARRRGRLRSRLPTPVDLPFIDDLAIFDDIVMRMLSGGHARMIGQDTQAVANL